jgi:adenylate kinase family enzyme
MRKVAVFGNAGGGKSALARQLAEVTRLPLYPLDTIQFKPGGGEVPHAEYLKAHKELLSRDVWTSMGLAVLLLPESGSLRRIR